MKVTYNIVIFCSIFALAGCTGSVDETAKSTESIDVVDQEGGVGISDEAVADDRSTGERPPRGERRGRGDVAEQVGTADASTLSAPSGTYLFAEKALTTELQEGDCTLSNGDDSKCLNVAINTVPQTRTPGPFCPETITAGSDESGVWLDGENFYEADGAFIASLAEIYDDPNWKLYNDDGRVKITQTLEAFEAAARPNVDPAYQNHCVEGKAEWVESEAGEYVIPSDPVYVGTAQSISGKVGVTFDGVVIDPSAPVDAILGAYTIAAFDDCGGHFNPTTGYHMHGALGCGEAGEVPAGETKPFALAMDGFQIHSPYDAKATPSDLDACNGHETDELGYHYHAQSPEKNGVLTCLMGATVR